jgi:hypothetical protein
MKKIIPLMLILCTAQTSAMRETQSEIEKVERPKIYAPSWAPPWGHRYT